MKHFLDLGAHQFEGLAEFTEKLGINEEWKVYSYEANPFTHAAAMKKFDGVAAKYASLEMNNLAVMHENGWVSFKCRVGGWENGRYRDGFSAGSTALDQPIQGVIRGGLDIKFKYEEVSVQSVDINEVLDAIVQSDAEAEIYIKCDIEGSEYVVLPRLLESPHLPLIKEMFVEWHERFWKDCGEEDLRIQEKNELIEQVEALGIKYASHW